MFKHITIELASPICTCKEQDLSWAIVLNERGKAGLKLACETCKVSLVIPNERFKAGFKLDQPYPGKETPPEKKEEDDEKDKDNKGLHLVPPPENKDAPDPEV